MRSTFVAAGKILATLLAAAEAVMLPQAGSAVAAVSAPTNPAAFMSTAITSHYNNNIDNNNNSNNNNNNNNQISYYYKNNNNAQTLNYKHNNNNYQNIKNNNNNISKSNSETEFHSNSTFIVTTDDNLTASMTATATIMTSAAAAAATTSPSPSTSTKITNEDISLIYTDGEMDPATIYVPPSQRPETYIVTVLFTLIFIVGVLGNGTLVIIFFRHRSMRNIPNTYILSLALADLLVIIVCIPMATIVYTQESWTFGVNLCRISEFFKDISIGVSVFTLTALSGERYCAIVNPLRKLQTKPLTVFTAAMIWLLAIFLGTPSFIVSDVDEIDIEIHNFTLLVCTPFGKNSTNTETYAKYTVISKACIYYILPLSIIGALYILMAKRLQMSAREMPGEALGMQSRSQARARRHVARMVVAFVVVFFACFFPYHLFELWFHLNPTAVDDFDSFWHAIRIIGFCTSFLHSCVNPVTLYCISGVFRQHFNRYLCCLCVKRQPRLRQHSTATAMMDTSIMSIRRSNTASNYNRGSLYINNATLSAGTGSNTTVNAFHRQQQSFRLHRGSGSGSGSGTGSGSLCANNNIGTCHAGTARNGNTSGTGGTGGIGGIGMGNNPSTGSIRNNNRNNATKSGIAPAQSIILSDKR